MAASWWDGADDKQAVACVDGADRDVLDGASEASGQEHAAADGRAVEAVERVAVGPTARLWTEVTVPRRSKVVVMAVMPIGGALIEPNARGTRDAPGESS